MNAAYFRRMIDYTYWADRQVWSCILELSDEHYRQPSDFSRGSVHQQVVHMVNAEWFWLQRVRNVAQDMFFEPDDFPTRDSVQARWDVVEASWREFVSAITDDQLRQPIVYIGLDNVSREQARWEIVAHMVNHSTDHRAQTMALMHQLGEQTLEQDYIFYTWKNPLGEAVE